ncbi:MAG: hypothetical protein AAFY15_14010, partial [Cyanobacteria bacterium J06648_11]
MYLLVTVICVAVSTWSTFQGFRSLLGILSLPVSLVIGAILFATDYVIQQVSRTGGKLTGPITLLVLAMFFSGTSNFNYFYTNAMGSRVATDRLQDAYQTFEVNMLAADSALRQRDFVQNLDSMKAEIENELVSLRAEMLDPNNSGYGEKAQSHRARIEELLPKRLQQKAPPRDGATPAELDEWVFEFRVLVETQLNSLEQSNEITDVLAEIENAREIAADQFAEMQGAAQPSTTKIRQISEWELETERIEALTNRSLIDNGGSSVPLILDPIRAVVAELGDIVYSLRSAFIDRDDIGVTIFASIASIIIDIL